MSLFAKRGLGESHSGFLQLSLAIIPETKRLESKFQRQLNLPRIVYSPRCPIVLIRRTFGESGECRRATTYTRTKWAEIRGAINRVEVANVQSVGEVGRFGDEFEAALLAEIKLAGNAHIHGTEIIADEGIARLDAYAVVVSENVAVRVESSELREAHRRLNGGNNAKQKVPSEGVPCLGRRYRRIEHDPVPDVVRRQRALLAEILAVLWNQHEAGIRAIVDGLRPCVADAVGKVMCKPLVHVD